MDRVISFDCYGTIIDWETGIVQALSEIFAKRGIRVQREEMLKHYAQVEAMLEKEYCCYKDILRNLVAEIARRYGIYVTDKEKNVLVDSLPSWPAFSDSRDALLKIKEKNKIAIISNIDNDLIERTIENLSVEFDFVITAEMVKAYKPSVKVFEYAYKVFGVPKSKWIHAAQSVYHDILPAKKYGIKVVWIRRRGYGATLPVEGSADLVFENLEELSEYLSEK